MSIAIGTIYTIADQRYVVTGSEPYRRAWDGQMTTLYELETTCPQPGCGATFTLKAGAAALERDPLNLNRRCPAHKAKGQRVDGGKPFTRNKPSKKEAQS